MCMQCLVRGFARKSGVDAGLTLVTWQTCVKCVCVCDDTPAYVLDSHVVVNDQLPVLQRALL